MLVNVDCVGLVGVDQCWLVLIGIGQYWSVLIGVDCVDILWCKGGMRRAGSNRGHKKLYWAKEQYLNTSVIQTLGIASSHLKNNLFTTCGVSIMWRSINY